MKTQHDVDLLLDRWFSEGETEFSDRALDATLDIVEHTPQRRVLRLPWRNRSMLLSMRLGAAAALAVVVVLGGAYLLTSPSPQVGQSPAPSPAATSAPSPTPTGSPAGSPPPEPTLIPGTSLMFRNTKLTDGTQYSTAKFSPAFSIQGRTGWWYLDGGPEIVGFANGPNEPNPPDTYEFSMAIVHRLINPSGSTTLTIPSDLVAWLQARPDLSLGAPTNVTVGGLHGTAIQGTVRGSVTGDGGVNLLCPTQTNPCGQGQPGALGVGFPGAFELIVIRVRGLDLVIQLQGPSTDWATNASVLDPMLSGLSFPAVSN